MHPADFLTQIAALSPDQAATHARQSGLAVHILPAPQDLPRLAAAARAIAASLGRGAPAVVLLTDAQGATADQLAPLLLGYDRVSAIAPMENGAALIGPGSAAPAPVATACTMIALLVQAPASQP
jgi:hypothetical protein